MSRRASFSVAFAVILTVTACADASEEPNSPGATTLGTGPVRAPNGTNMGAPPPNVGTTP